MRCTGTVDIDEDQAGVDRAVDRGGVRDPGELGHAQVAVEGQGQQHLPDGPRELLDARAEQVLDAARHGDVLADLRQLAADEHSAELEQEQRVSPARLLELADDSDRQAETEPLEQDPARGAQAHGADFEPFDPGGVECALEVGWFAGAPREQKAHRVPVQPAGGVPERFGGGAVEPGNVVDGDQQRILLGQRTQDAQEPGGDGKRLGGLAVRLGTQQRGLEGAALRSRHCCQVIQVDCFQQVCERSEREPGLRVVGPGGEDA